MLYQFCIATLSLSSHAAGGRVAAAPSPAAPPHRSETPFLVADLNAWSKSQLGEEKHLLETYFTLARDNTTHVFTGGTFVELGALDGTMLSNSRTLQYALGWAGVLIEACPGHWPALAKRAQQAPSVEVIKSAVCHPKPLSGQVNFSSRCAPTSSIRDGVARGDRMTQALRVQADDDDRDQRVQVPCDGLGSLLLSRGVEHVDVLSIDVEGYEVPLLRSMDFARISVHVIVIEVDHNGPSEVQAIHQLLSAAGFELDGILGGDAIWVHRMARHKSAGRWMPGRVSGDGWSHRQKHCLVSPGMNLSEGLRDYYLRRDAAYDSTDFFPYVQRLAAMPARHSATASQSSCVPVLSTPHDPQHSRSWRSRSGQIKSPPRQPRGHHLAIQKVVLGIAAFFLILFLCTMIGVACDQQHGHGGKE